MKSKATAFFLTALVLYIFQGGFITYSSWFNIHADKPVEALFKYENERGIFRIYQEKGEAGFISFPVSDKKIVGFWLNITGDAKINAVQFSGREERFFPVQGDFSKLEIPLESRFKVDFLKLTIISGLSFYFFCFCINVFSGGKILYPEKIPQFKSIEFLRVIFTLAIVYHHIGDTLGYESQAWLSVEFFFILSGFFLLFRLYPGDTIAFIKQKLIRFWPLLLFGSLICCLFEKEVSPAGILSEVLFLSGSGFYWQHGYNPPSWYVCTLFWVLLFYFYLIKTQKRENADLIIGLICFFSYAALTRIGFGRLWDTLDGIGSMIPLGMLRATAGVGSGYFLARLYQKREKNSCGENLSDRLFFTAAETAALFYALWALFFQRPYPENNIFSVISFVLLIFLFVCGRGYVSRFLDKAVFARAGRYCFAVFMTHSFITRNLLTLVRNQYPDLVMRHVPYTVALTILAACLAGIAFHYIIEIPWGRALKRYLR